MTITLGKRFFKIFIPVVAGVVLLTAAAILCNAFLFNVERDGVQYKWVRGGYSVVGYEGEGGEVVIAEKIGRRSVISVAEYAFENEVSITAITVPTTVTRIGFGAFDDCTGLQTLTLPFVGDAAKEPEQTHIGYLFGGPEKQDNDCVMPRTLTKVNVTGDSALGASAFASCRYLTEVTLGNATPSVGGSAFQDCVALVSVTLGEGLTAIGEAAFAGCVALPAITLPDGVTRVENATFKDCAALVDVALPDALVAIGPSAFANCALLESITIPAGVTSIDTFAFRNCVRLRKLTLPDKLARIGAFAFDGCRYLRDVTFEGDGEWRITGSETSFIPPDGKQAALYLRETYATEVWRRVGDKG